MNLKIRILYVILTLIFITGCVNNSIKCTTIDEVASSIAVEKKELTIVGLNADTDSLVFGVVSPTASAKRSINVQYSEEAQVTVKMEGDFSSWTSIEPKEFLLNPNETQKVTFVVDIPWDASVGIYTGRVLFCFRE